MERSGYNSHVSDKQWERLQEYLPELSTRGTHLRKWEQRVIINAILYSENMIYVATICLMFKRIK